MEKKVIVVIYNEDDWNKKNPLEKAAATREATEDLHRRGLENGVEFYRASIKWYDEKKEVFKKAWAFRDGRWIKKMGTIKPDLLFDKIAGKHDYRLFDFKIRLARKIKLFNSPLFRTMLDNKLAQYLLLSEFMPKSFLATNRKELLQMAKKIKSAKIVLKPLYGSGGAGIIINKKDKALKKKVEYPVFVQEFLKSTRGIPGFSKRNELADLRMIFMNHKLIYALSRIAKKGSLFTNFHQGAKVVSVPEKSVPKVAKKIAAEIINRLEIFPEAHYSLDFIFTDSGKPILIEMNTTPGFDLLQMVGTEAQKKKNLQEIINVLKY